MSGQPKPTEAEALRQLIREAHEAMKDLRLAIKEIRAERAEHVDFLDKILRLAADAGVEQIAGNAETALDFIQSQTDRLFAHISELISTDTREDLADKIVKECARQLASQLMIGIDDQGNPAIVPRNQRGEIFVTTDPALAPPGSIILDAR